MGGGTQSAANLKKLLSCSHTRAIDLFIESIRARDAPGCGLIAYSCSNYTAFLDGKCTLCGEAGGSDSCARMGFHAADSFDGSFTGNKKFFLTTNSRAPYCLYHYGGWLPLTRSLINSSACYSLGVAVKFAKKPRNSARGGNERNLRPIVLTCCLCLLRQAS